MHDKNVSIEINSNMDGDRIRENHKGVFKERNGLFYVVYKDNNQTRNMLKFTETSLLLHRSGPISGDMVFDPGQVTKVNYRAGEVAMDFRLLTEEYRLTVREGGFDLHIRYQLHSGPEVSGQYIKGRQNITIRFE